MKKVFAMMFVCFLIFLGMGHVSSYEGGILPKSETKKEVSYSEEGLSSEKILAPKKLNR